MISKKNVLSTFSDFTRAAGPILQINNEQVYADALDLLEYLMEQVGEDVSKSENLLILLLSHAIHTYELQNEEVLAFEKHAFEDQSDVVVLRFIISQHGLSLSDLPEIGHKSLISKILSGERNLTKSHIEKLSKRFHIDPGLFFGSIGIPVVL